MIAIDSSALVSIVLSEPGWQCLKSVLDNGEFAIGWPTVLESRIVLGRKGLDRPDIVVADFVATKRALKVSFDEDHYLAAEQAYSAFGKGSGHPAKLNYGDCMAYAVARLLDAPLLFKGADFPATDVKVHPASVLA